MEFKAGSLVRLRHRDWVVLPSPNRDLLLLKPLGGSEAEITGVYLPLNFAEDRVETTSFPLPAADDLGDFTSARLLYNAVRLSFRNGAGPFRSLARLSFRPRAYQMVPLILALRQEGPLRLLIADDVGVGKTIEALLILRELLDRGEIRRFAVVVLPHLCEQWQAELRDKFGIEAVIIRSNTQARLDREIPGDTSVYEYYPYQVISIDYIKSEQRRQVFIQECPELVIVDEAHTCTWAGSRQSARQQRHALVRDIALKPGQHLLLLTATPHSGKQEQFSSLLGLIDPQFAGLDLPRAKPAVRKEFARYYVQRRRADVLRWMGEDTPFPHREAGEFQYALSPRYGAFYDRMLAFAMGLTRGAETHEGRKKIRYWTALGLLRGVMSSPAAGLEMLNNRLKSPAREEASEPEPEAFNPVLDEDDGAEQDFTPLHLLEKADWSAGEARRLRELAEELSQLQNLQDDAKAAAALEILQEWIEAGYHPVVFCRFIATANYLGALLKPVLPQVDVQVVTSEDPDELRKARIDEMGKAGRRLLIATDCLSEGINLQKLFTAVLHYDLPWNPNRLEQREGRIDRYGQQAPTVKAFLLYGSDNPIDGVVLKVLLRKVREIRQSIGISLPFPEDSQSLMDAVLQSVLLTSRRHPDRAQLALDFGESEETRQKELVATRAIEEAAEREKASRTIFAQHAVRAEEIEQDLQQTDEAIGNPAAVEALVTEALTVLLGVQIRKTGRGYELYTTNLPPVLKETLPGEAVLKISFTSPTPEGHLYLGRNHPFVEQLCQHLMAHALNREGGADPARAAVLKTREVALKTTLLLFRVRNVIEEKQGGQQLVAEEMLLWGYRGHPDAGQFLEPEQVRQLLDSAQPSANLTPQARAAWLEEELQQVAQLQETLYDLARQRAAVLVEAHERFRKVIGGARYRVVEPVLPMDLLGVYVLLPDLG